MNGIRIIILSCFLFHLTIGYSQKYFKTYSQIVVCPDDTAEYHEFILVKRNDNKETARKINERMLKEIFWEDDYYVMYDKRKDSCYIKKNDMPSSVNTYEPCPKIAFENSIVRNDSLVFVLNHSGEGCGAYCEALSFTYNFISKTGEEIRFKNMFEPKAYYFIDKSILQNRRKIIKKQISSLKKELVTSTGEEADWNRDAIEMYEGCVYFHDYPYKYKSMNDTSFITESEELQVDGNKLIIRGDRCSPHALRAMDDLGDFVDSLSYSIVKDCFVKKYFNLLLPEQKYSEYNYYLYSGKMNNKITITFLLMVGKTSVKGLYFYDSQGIIIPLDGKMNSNTIELFEKNEKGETKYKFSLKKEAKSLSGTWSGLDSSKEKELGVVMQEVNDFIIIK